MQGKLFIISGCSGVGKGTLLKMFLEKNPDIKLSISATTRKPRNNEIDGINYFFTSKEDFEEAIKNALDNAKLNNIKNVTFEAGLAEEVVKKWKDKANVLVVDPPRKGIDEALVNTILESNFEKIVYVSCNPTTLARDVRMLSDKYKVKTIQPVDMFPHTHHVETVVLLYRK